MKKTLIALAVAASAVVSGSAMAGLGDFNASNTNNTVNFGGTITPTVVKNNWVWAVGTGYDNFSNDVSELTDSGKTLTLTAKENMPILVGKATAAFKGETGIAPQIAFSDSTGTINPVWGGDNAEGTLTVAVNNAGQQQIGAMTLNVKAFAPILWAKGDASTGVSVRYSDGKAGAFTGSTGVFAASPNFASVDAILSAFGAPSVQELQDQIRAFNGLGNINLDTSDVVGASSDPYNANAWVYTGAYALGIPSGKQMEIKFNKAITDETQWKAPLTMLVTYS